MTNEELKKWLRDNSSGVYRPASDAADLIERLESDLLAQTDVNHVFKEWRRTDELRLADVRKVAALNNAAMNGTVLRLRSALAELTGEPSNIPNTPNALDNLKAVAHAQSEFERIKLAE